MFAQLCQSLVILRRPALDLSHLRIIPQLCRTAWGPSGAKEMATQPHHSKKRPHPASDKVPGSEAKLKHIRRREKRKGNPMPNVNVSAQIIGSGSRDSPASVLILADSTRLLFNCGEGTQRLLMDSKMKHLARLEHIFFTRMTWENLGGAIGMMMTLKKIGLPQLTFYGPEHLNNFVSALGIFAQQDIMQLDVKCPDDAPFVNDVMVVKPVVIRSSALGGREQQMASTTEGSPDNPDTEEGDEAGAAKKRKVDLLGTISGMNVKPQQGKQKMTTLSNVCIAYVCKLHDKKGQLMVDKAAALGLPPGKKFSQLKQGESVTTDDGKVIQPEDVIGPKQTGPTFIVLECPSEEFIESLVNHPSLVRHHREGDSASPVAIVHICPPNILDHRRYKEWMSRFDDSVDHIVCNSVCHSVTHLKSRRLQARLGLLHPGIFPPQSLPQRPDCPEMNVRYARSYEKLHLMPEKRWNGDSVQTDDPQSFLDEIEELPDFKTSLEELQGKLLGGHEHLTTRYPEVVFLGTGSASPNLDRNVSSIVLHVSESQNLLMDCGEGTFNQMCRFYGDRTDDVILNLGCIFVSHRHADHHTGLLQILKYWKKLVGKDTLKNLLLVAPKRIFIWLNQYNKYCEEIIHHLKFIECGDLTESAVERSNLEQTLLKRLNLEKIETVPVRHCPFSYGLAVTHRHGWKVVYSGDTMPCEELVTSGLFLDCSRETVPILPMSCEELVTAGQGADLLIHEATLEDGLGEEARIKKHSMISEAIDIGERMNAKFIMLTHFSQRYPKMPLLPERVSGKVGIAFDFMRLSLSDVSKLPLFMPVLKHLFADKIQELYDIKNKRAEKKLHKLSNLMNQEEAAGSR